jgi:hypothetical protein
MLKLQLKWIWTGALVSVLAVGLADASGRHHRLSFALNGPIKVSTVPCTPNICFDITSNHLLDSEGHVFDLDGSGQIDESACREVKRKMCCTATETGKVSNGTGVVDEAFAASACTNRAETQMTLKGALEITGGTGLFTGAEGSGRVSAQFKTANGKGSITLKGKIHD